MKNIINVLIKYKGFYVQVPASSCPLLFASLHFSLNFFKEKETFEKENLLNLYTMIRCNVLTLLCSVPASCSMLMSHSLPPCHGKNASFIIQQNKCSNIHNGKSNMTSQSYRALFTDMNSLLLKCVYTFYVVLLDFGVVVDIADTVLAQSLTMPTRCWCSQRLCRHGVGVVNNYFSTCLCSQRLRGHAIFNIKLHFLLLVTLVFFFEIRIISPVSAQLLTMLTQCPRSP